MIGTPYIGEYFILRREKIPFIFRFSLFHRLLYAPIFKYKQFKESSDRDLRVIFIYSRSFPRPKN